MTILEISTAILNTVPRATLLHGDIRGAIKAFHQDHNLSCSGGFISSVLGTVRDLLVEELKHAEE